jgi:hypothetical protein
MKWITEHPVFVLLMVVAALCSIAAYATQSLLALVVTILFVLASIVVLSLPQSSNRKREAPAAQRIEPAAPSPGEKRWIDCAYCDGTGAIVAERLATRRGVIRDDRATCPICSGDGQLFTTLWSQPPCRRCHGTGKLRSSWYNRFSFPQFNTKIEVCERCGGTGRRPFPRAE